ncbi:MAG TPA: alpha/beta hydrolase [Acidimicrobiales bacterium]|jgi:pimeloyl-ACP methyl ester carboxylesterase
MEISERRVEANGVDFAVLEAGPDDGPLALCLHGFPDSAHTWDGLLPVLGEAGFRAVAPFMRGYHPTGPAPDGRYQRGVLAADAIALHSELGGDHRAVVIGHDWGAIATYGAAAHSPALWRRVVTMAVPPLAVAGAALADYDQLKRSFYFFLFQLPLGEGLVAGNDMAFIDGLWRDWGPGWDAGAPEHVKVALRPEGCLLAAMTYYRAMLQPDLLDLELSDLEGAGFMPLTQPTLYLHGDSDGAYRADLTQVPALLGEGSEVVEIRDAGHFVHLDQPSLTHKLVVDFLTRP